MKVDPQNPAHWPWAISAVVRESVVDASRRTRVGLKTLLRTARALDLFACTSEALTVADWNHAASLALATRRRPGTKPGRAPKRRPPLPSGRERLTEAAVRLGVPKGTLSQRASRAGVNGREGAPPAQWDAIVAGRVPARRRAA